MQFVRGGPDVPERLLHAHEEGRVVFFCGAGISYPARLPGFAGLVDELYSRLEVIPDPVQAAAIKAKRYDTAVGLPEASSVGGYRAVSQKIAEILDPDISAPNATATHDALLSLAKCRERRTRRRVPLLDRYVRRPVRLQNRINDPGEPVQLRTMHGLPPTIARRRRIAQHLLHCPPVDPEPTARLGMAQTLLDNRKSNRCIKLHAIHLPPRAQIDKGLQVVQFCTAATGPTGRFLWSIIPPPLTLGEISHYGESNRAAVSWTERT